MKPSSGQNKIRQIAGTVFLCLMAFLFLWYLHVLYTYSSKATPLYIQLLRCAAAGLAVWLGRLWKERTWRLLFAFWLLLFLRILIPMPDQLLSRDVKEWLFLGLWLYCGCFGLARVLPEKQLKRFLAACAGVWIAAIVAYSVVGICAAWTGQKIMNLAGKANFRINQYNRLKMIVGQNQSAAILVFTALVALLLIFSVKKAAVRLLLVPAVLVMLVPMCLTGCRTAMYTFALGLGGMAGMQSLRFVDRKRHPSGKACWITAAAVFAVTAACAVLLLSRVTPLFNHFKTNGFIVASASAETAAVESADVESTAGETAPVESAAAETAAEETTAGETAPVESAAAESAAAESAAGSTGLAERGLTGLTDREDIWLAVLQHLGNNPLLLLTGTSLVDPMDGPNQIMPREDIVPHSHNVLLHVLLESGIPGLLLIGAFVVILGIRALRLLKNGRTLPPWLPLAAVFVLAVWAGELVECFLILMRHRTPMQPIAFTLMGIVSAYGQINFSKKNDLNS